MHLHYFAEMLANRGRDLNTSTKFLERTDRILFQVQFVARAFGNSTVTGNSQKGRIEQVCLTDGLDIRYVSEWRMLGRGKRTERYGSVVYGSSLVFKSSPGALSTVEYHPGEWETKLDDVAFQYLAGLEEENLRAVRGKRFPFSIR
jgi:hypothetical protein